MHSYQCNSEYRCIDLFTFIKLGSETQKALLGMMSLPVALNFTFMMTAPMMKYNTSATIALRRLQ